MLSANHVVKDMRLDDLAKHFEVSIRTILEFLHTYIYSE